MKRIGIVAHSAEGGALCFLSACRSGFAHIGTHMHPEIVLSAIPMGVSMDAWRRDDYPAVARHLRRGIDQVAAAGADFFICPDNTAHIALELIADGFPIPGLHIADVTAAEIVTQGWKRAGLLGTRWTMEGSIYEEKLAVHGVEVVTPTNPDRDEIDRLIFDELCQSVFSSGARACFSRVIDSLRDRDAECVILGCTEIPLIVDDESSPLPTLDTTRLLAEYAVREAISARAASRSAGWLDP